MCAAITAILMNGTFRQCLFTFQFGLRFWRSRRDS
jgi:hypothetical protein